MLFLQHLPAVPLLARFSVLYLRAGRFVHRSSSVLKAWLRGLVAATLSDSACPKATSLPRSHQLLRLPCHLPHDLKPCWTTAISNSHAMWKVIAVDLLVHCPEVGAAEPVS